VTSTLTSDRDVKVPLLVPILPAADKLQPYLARIDANRWYSNFGPLVNELEMRLAQSFADDASPIPKVVTVSNATAGIELALRALNLPANAYVLVPAFTFVATAIAVLSAGLTPICVDVDADTWQLTPAIAEDALARADIQAVLPVCVFGREQPGAEWSAFHARTGIPVVIDAAAAYGNQIDPGPTCAVFSMHATKPLSSAEGGFVVTRSDGLAESIRQLSNFGINLTRPDVAPIGTSTMVGVNAKLSEYHAAIGHASLDVWPESARMRRKVYARYADELSEAGNGGIAWQDADSTTIRSVCAFVLRSRSIRDTLEVACANAGVATRRWYCPTVDQHPAFRHLDPLATPTAYQIADRLLGVPFFPTMDERAQSMVARLVHDSLG
jgi:dTDP-4-amino-4,6-dideoxygalactose transaminase